MLVELSGLVLGLVGLWLGTEWTIDNALLIAKRYQLSDIFVGVAILAIGSDLPELAVAIDAGIKTLGGTPASAMVIGTSIGSAYAQIGLVVGISGLSGYLLIGKAYLLRHGTVVLASIFVLWLLALDQQISRTDGLILLILFVIYFLILLRQENNKEDLPSGKSTGNTLTVWLKLAGGMIVVIAASEMTVFSAIALAERLEIAQRLIATFIVGVGTSLPELSISLQAVKKRKGALSVGNILGSNIFDTLVPIGAAATISPLYAEPYLIRYDLPALAALSLLVILFFLRKKGLQRKEAMTILAVYFGYLSANLLLRQVG